MATPEVALMDSMKHEALFGVLAPVIFPARVVFLDFHHDIHSISAHQSARMLPGSHFKHRDLKASHARLMTQKAHPASTPIRDICQLAN
jgi:hypothetical protein